MEVVEPYKRARFCNNFRAMAHNIAKGLSDSQDPAAKGHCTKWAEFCQCVSPNHLLVFYRDPVPIINTFARQYRTGSLTPSRHQLLSRTVEDAASSISQALAAMGDHTPASKVKGS